MTFKNNLAKGYVFQIYLVSVLSFINSFHVFDYVFSKASAVKLYFVVKDYKTGTGVPSNERLELYKCMFFVCFNDDIGLIFVRPSLYHIRTQFVD